MDNGAHFHCCDLQVHSPRDLHWSGDCPTTTEERRQYAAEFVAACRQKRLQAVAITDHHDVAFVPFIRDAAAEERDPQGQAVPAGERLVVFPGIELTLGVPHQALVLFDPDTPDTTLLAALTVLGIVPSPADAPKIAATVRLPNELDVNEIRKRFTNNPNLRDRFIILPNVNSGGDDTILRSGFADHYRTMHCVGGYTDGSLTDHAKRHIVDGKDPNWGKKAIGVIQTSDSRERSFENLGKDRTWIKWSVPSAEALRQACLAPASRIRHEPPRLPACWIRRVHVSDSRFFGPFSVELNPQANTIIGGRGSGKSTILEYIRWALADQSHVYRDDDGSEVPDYERRRRSLVGATLKPKAAAVTVECVNDGVVHTVTRNAATGEVTLKIGERAAEPVSESLVQSVIGIQGYSQKQLSHVSVRTSELERLLTAPIAHDLGLLNSSIDSHASALRNAFAQNETRLNLEHQLRLAEADLESKQQRLKALNQGIGELPDELRKEIEAHPLFEQGTRANASLVDAVDTVSAAVSTAREDVATAIDDLAPVGDAFPGELLAAFRERVVTLLQSVNSGLILIEADIEKVAPELSSAQSAVEAEISAHETRYSQASSEHATIQERLTAFKALSAEVTKARHSRDGLRSQVDAFGDTVSALTAARHQWLKLLSDQTALFQKQAAALTAASGGQLRVVIRERGDFSVPKQRLEDTVRGAGLTVPEKFSRLFDVIAGDTEPLRAWLDTADEFVELAMSSAASPTGGDIPTTPRLALAGYISTELRRIAGKVNPTVAFDLTLVIPGDLPCFEYRSEDGTYVPFETASPGQQATALIALLMNQQGGPLVIDQPEDDLDNATISKVSERLWTAKESRQIVFVSHNPNLVVIGDAELVLHCDCRANTAAVQIAHQGAIDVPAMNKVISTVMEGGKEAFRLRKEKYGF